MKTFNVKAKAPKPKWYKFRNRLSNFFMWLARKCYAENPEVHAFFMKQLIDYSIYGRAVTRVDWNKINQGE